MGTRSITHIHEMEGLRDEEIVCTFYRQFDGYPAGHGDDLAKWLKDKKLVNGIGVGFIAGRDHNRAGQMAVELMHELKVDTSIEVMPTGSCGHGEEFTYHIYFKGGQFYIVCDSAYDGGESLFNGLASDFNGKKIQESYE